jgi:alkylhydroperoxidase family enzyme
VGVAARAEDGAEHVGAAFEHPQVVMVAAVGVAAEAMPAGDREHAGDGVDAAPRLGGGHAFDTVERGGRERPHGVRGEDDGMLDGVRHAPTVRPGRTVLPGPFDRSAAGLPPRGRSTVPRMARIQPVDVDRLPEPHGSAYQAAMAGRDGPRINIHGTVGHSPSVLVRFVAFANELRNGTVLDARLRELTILTVSHAKGAGYEFGKHANLGLSVGVPREQIEAIERGDAPGAADALFDDVSRAVVALAHEAVTQVRVSDATWAAAAAHLSERELVEVLLHVGMYSLTAHLTEAVQVDIEPWFERR